MDALGIELIERYKESADDANFYRKLFNDRSQMFGILINLLLQLEIKDTVFSEEDIKSSTKYIVILEPIENNTALRVYLRPNEEYNDESKDKG